jgi:hypothetical protein
VPKELERILLDAQSHDEKGRKALISHGMHTLLLVDRIGYQDAITHLERCISVIQEMQVQHTAEPIKV